MQSFSSQDWFQHTSCQLFLLQLLISVCINIMLSPDYFLVGFEAVSEQHTENKTPPATTTKHQPYKTSFQMIVACHQLANLWFTFLGHHFYEKRMKILIASSCLTRSTSVSCYYLPEAHQNEGSPPKHRVSHQGQDTSCRLILSQSYCTWLQFQI